VNISSKEPLERVKKKKRTTSLSCANLCKEATWRREERIVLCWFLESPRELMVYPLIFMSGSFLLDKDMWVFPLYWDFPC